MVELLRERCKLGDAGNQDVVAMCTCFGEEVFENGTQLGENESVAGTEFCCKINKRGCESCQLVGRQDEADGRPAERCFDETEDVEDDDGNRRMDMGEEARERYRELFRHLLSW